MIAPTTPDVRTWAIMGAVSGSQLSGRRYRRRILGWGAAALAVTFVAGSAITLARVEDDLESRVDDELVDAGIVGVTASFSGQDATLDCAAPLDDPSAVLDLVSALKEGGAGASPRGGP